MKGNDYVCLPKQLFNEGYTSIIAKADKLCHVTHNEEAMAISEQEDKYIFKPRSKKGKSHDGWGLPLGESYFTTQLPDLEREYTRVASNQDVLPQGSYTWWSFDIPKEKKFTVARNVLLSPPFKSPEASMYGNVKFSCGLTQLLKCYLNAYKSKFGSHLDAHIEFRCGGTLRYRYEICYVIIVCVVLPGVEPCLSQEEYKVIEDHLWEGVAPVKYIDGAVDKVVPPDLLFENAVKGLDGCLFSWDTYALALHFPDDSYTLEMPKEWVEISEVDHDNCLRGSQFCPLTDNL